MKVPKDTEYFKYYNANPHNKHSTVCVIRAISLATGNTYNEIVRKLVEIYVKTGYHITDRKCYFKLLDQEGFKKCKQPKTSENKKLTGSEFCSSLACNNNKNIIVAHIGSHHVVCIKDNKLYDIFNCEHDYIGVYWIKECV